ncbi:hypothetical protein GCM10023318_18730 [Nocardia callitridis]|uniref:DUF3592 domain-containing protein n=1 Tax=Nocardia callitridis TaxID=648753 RepID=A0ABP9K5U3_9NOCA
MQTGCAACLAMLFLVVVPLLAVLIGGSVYREQSAAVQAERARMHEVEATVVETGKAPLYAPIMPVHVRWRAADGTERDGDYQSTVVLEPGAQVTIWLDDTQRIVEPPSSTQALSKAVLLTAGAVCLTLLALLCCYALLRFELDRRRLRQWENEWVAADLLWGSHG